MRRTGFLLLAALIMVGVACHAEPSYKCSDAGIVEWRRAGAFAKWQPIQPIRFCTPGKPVDLHGVNVARD